MLGPQPPGDPVGEVGRAPRARARGVGRRRPSADCAPTEPARPDVADAPRVVVDRERAELRARRRRPSRCTSAADGVPASSPIVLMPRSASRCRVTGPTPHMRPTGSGSRNSRSRSGLDHDQPVGLGDLGRDLGQVLGAARRRPRSGARPRRGPGGGPRVAMAAGGPNRCVAPVTSRNASSIEMRSTSGVTSPRIVITASASRWYSPKCPPDEDEIRGRAAGPASPACPPCTPNAFASYDAASTTPPGRCRRPRWAGRAARGRAAARPTRRRRRGRRAGSWAPRAQDRGYSNMCSSDKASAAALPCDAATH